MQFRFVPEATATKDISRSTLSFKGRLNGEYRLPQGRHRSSRAFSVRLSRFDWLAEDKFRNYVLTITASQETWDR